MASSSNSFDNPIPVKDNENATNDLQSNGNNRNEESGEKVDIENPDFIVRHLHFMLHKNKKL